MEEIVALIWTLILVIFIKLLKFGKATAGLNGLSVKLSINNNIKHIQIADLGDARNYLYCVSHCIWIYNLFYLSANY